ncbi:MAG: peptidylprolyl isomerase [Sulfobacillus thermosulfidooxidans]|uniref:peptidyl-prolyl cis-trans isomerase n=1 Tax=Sulfobacillus TaxID=28033 RepID=UPI000CD106BB|nr:peptidyl-prolyl cis-trans isomerase [Sulfobacillus sp. hq2]POB10824.1 peptidylprolyl isomerase [Sulfobacillus sp. hq2]PSR34000.1 MAG: peptidylprolyl isomerase [Sulfobacillus thermosulfidooxidans]
MRNPQHWPKLMATVVGLSVSAAALAGCGQQSSAAPKPLAVVNGKDLTTAQLNTMVRMTELFNGSTLPNTKQEKISEVKYLVQEKSVEDWTLAHHLTTKAKAEASAKTVLDKSIEPEVGGVSGLDKMLKSKGVTMSQLNDYLTQQMILQQAYNQATKNVKPITTAAAESFYKANPQYFTGSPQVELEEITVKSQSEAQTLEKQVEAGASFAALAKKDTTNTTLKSKGGEVGWTPESLQSLSPAVYKEVQSLKPGQFGITKGSHGYDLIGLQATKPAQVSPFSQVESEIKANLLQTAQGNAYQAFASKIEKQARVKIFYK